MLSVRFDQVMDHELLRISAENPSLPNPALKDILKLEKPLIPVYLGGKEAKMNHFASNLRPQIRHIPVLLKEVLTLLEIKKDGIYVDCTIGEGGHSEAILKELGGKGLLIGLDKDEKSLNIARERLKDFSNKLKLVKDDFKNLPLRLKQMGIDKVDGLLFDLGVSSYQLQDSSRGFSFQEDGPLDMRMDSSSPLTAREVINKFSFPDLRKILIQYGEERNASRIVRRIVREREKEEVISTRQLAALVARAAYPPRRNVGGRRRSRIHPATRTFQALRIAVNQELENLPEVLSKVHHLLKPKGGVGVISYHSLEDRIVKRAFRKAQKEGTLQIITPKPVTPTSEEVNNNRRSRSAKLRVAEGVEVEKKGF